MTRALVVGAGSIGVRHARVLAELGHDVSAVSRRDDLELATFRTIADALAATSPEYVVVATETARHAGGVAELAAAGFAGDVLVEKPLALSEAETRDLPFRRMRVGYNLRFHPVTRRLAELVAGAEVVAVDAYVGQHLATWRPGRDVAEQYSAHAAAGGGVLRDLSHELDYLGMLFGRCLRVSALGGRLADVTVDSDDAWGVLASYERAPIVTTQLNYLAAPARRRVIVTTTGPLLEADFVAGEVRIGDETERLAAERDATYRGMHAAMIAGGDGVTTVEEALAVERLIGAIERSAAEARWVDA